MTKKNETTQKVSTAEAETVESVAATPEKAKADKNPSVPKFLKDYVKRYPANKTFHVTSDNQVFLASAYDHARNHQATLGKGELKTYNV